jgi:hypothetical protein
MKIKQLLVSTPQGDADVLGKESRFVFNYATGERSHEVSLTMLTLGGPRGLSTGQSSDQSEEGDSQ